MPNYHQFNFKIRFIKMEVPKGVYMDASYKLFFDEGTPSYAICI